MSVEIINFSEIDNQNNHYCNNYLWVSFAENFVPKIEKIINEELNSLNFREIFSNLKDFLKVEDIILNNKIYPYLSDVLENAALYPEKMHQIIYDEMIDLNNLELLEKFDLIFKNDLNTFELDLEKYIEFRDVVHDGFKNLFNEAKNQIIEYLHLNNVDFVDIIDAAKDCIKLFATFNLDSEDFEERLYEFGSKISEYLSLNTQSRMNKIDIDKMFAIVFSGENSKDTLFCDFDQKKNFNPDISNLDCDICPKFSIMRFEQHPEVIFTTGCHAALVFSPEASKKLFLMLLDHTLTNQLENLKNISPMPVCVEKRFEILFEYLSEQNINNSDEFNKFVSINQISFLLNLSQD
jgi:hypothetical protein